MSSEVISRLISELKPHPRNYNNHSDRQVDDLALSLKRFGQRKPIVTWRDMIVAGHGLTMAAQMAGWTSILTMPIPDDWDEATVLAYLAADNELARQADPDLAQLAAITKELEGIDEELAKLAAGGDDALKALMATIEDEKPNGDAEPQINKAEELRVKWGVELGQMWRLPSRDGKGEHRLICGDCTDRAVVERVMGGESGQICFTSPPYNLGKNIGISNRSQALKDSGSAYQGGEDDLKGSDYLELLIKFTDNALQFNRYAFINIQSLAGNKVALIDYVYHFRNKFADVAIWHKTNQQPAMAENVMNSSFEYIYIYSSDENPTRAIKTGNFRGTFSNVYTSAINNNEFSDVHGAAFPLEFSLHYISNFSTAGGIIYEPFSGTGTTLISSENTGRYCRAIEISPGYTAVALQRYFDSFAITPELVHDR